MTIKWNVFYIEGEKDTAEGKYWGYCVWRRSLKLDPPTIFMYTYSSHESSYFSTCKLAAHSTEEHSESLIQTYKEAQKNLNAPPPPIHTQFHRILSSILLGPCKKNATLFVPSSKSAFSWKPSLSSWTGISTASFRNCRLHWTVVSIQYLSVRGKNMAHIVYLWSFRKTF